MTIAESHPINTNCNGLDAIWEITPATRRRTGSCYCLYVEGGGDRKTRLDQAVWRVPDKQLWVAYKKRRENYGLIRSVRYFMDSCGDHLNTM